MEDKTPDHSAEIEALTNTIGELRTQLDELSTTFHRNNFSASQDFPKYSRFNTRIKVPVVSALPLVCEIGELVSFGGKLYHCSSANTWTAQT